MMNMGLGSGMHGLGQQHDPLLHPRPQDGASTGTNSSDRSPSGSASRSHALSLDGSPSWTSSMPTTSDPAPHQGLFYPFPDEMEQQHRPVVSSNASASAGMDEYMRFQYALAQQQQAQQQLHRLDAEYSYLLSDPHTLSGAHAGAPHRSANGSARGGSPADLGMIKYESP